MTAVRQPQPADFGVVEMPGDVGAAIKFGQFLNGDGFGKYQHAVLVLPNGKLVEAEADGARIVDISEYDGTNIVWSNWDLTSQQRGDIVEIGMQREGIPYSVLDYGAIAAHRLHIPAPGLRRYIEDSGHQICSQLVDWVYAQADVQLFDDGRWPGYVTPMSLSRALHGPVIA